MTPARQLSRDVEALRARGWPVARVCKELGVTRRALERYLAQARADDGEAVAQYRKPPRPVVILARHLMDCPSR